MQHQVSTIVYPFALQHWLYEILLCSISLHALKSRNQLIHCTYSFIFCLVFLLSWRRGLAEWHDNGVQWRLNVVTLCFNMKYLQQMARYFVNITAISKLLLWIWWFWPVHIRVFLSQFRALRIMPVHHIVAQIVSFFFFQNGQQRDLPVTKWQAADEPYTRVTQRPLVKGAPAAELNVYCVVAKKYGNRKFSNTHWKVFKWTSGTQKELNDSAQTWMPWH